MKTRVKEEWAGIHTYDVQAWLNTLSKSQKEELAQLDFQSEGGDQLKQDIVRDWIEEHDGRRYYWGYIITEDKK